MSDKHPKYIDPFSDTGFKAIFGRAGMSEDILRVFLNEVFRGLAFIQAGFFNKEKGECTGLSEQTINEL